MRILVVGAGIAGLTVANRLAGAGFDVVLLERSAKARRDGYMIDFFGPGFDVAERMGLLPDLAAAHYPVAKLWFVDRAGTPRGEVDYPRIREHIFADRHFNFLRGDLERVLFERLPTAVEVRFRTTVESIEAKNRSVRVSAGEGAERFDLVIGADGLHSRTRQLAFSGKGDAERYLGYRTAAFILPGAIPGLRRNSFVTLSEAGRSAAAYPIAGGRTAAFFVYRAPWHAQDHSSATCHRELQQHFRGSGWITDRLLDAFPTDGEAYFDDVSQVVMDAWRARRVVLLGDACGAVSLLAGQGASMAMAGAYVLARELERSPNDVDHAIQEYERRMRPAVEARQRSGRRNAAWFVPRSHFRAVLRDTLTDWLCRSPFVPLFRSALGATPIPLD